MELGKYLERINFPSGVPVKPNLATLRLVQSGQQQNIAYENVDVLLGKKKIVLEE